MELFETSCGCTKGGKTLTFKGFVWAKQEHIHIACRLEKPNVTLWFPVLFISFFMPKYRVQP